MTTTKTNLKNAFAFPVIHLKHAWLISWMGTVPWAGPKNPRSIMAILSGRHSEGFVEKSMVLLDMRAKCSAYEMAFYANRKHKFGTPTRIGPGIKMKGSNGWLYGRRVSDLRVTRDADTETIEWKEPDFVANNPETYQLEVRERGAEHKVVRNATEKLGAEPFHRWN